MCTLRAKAQSLSAGVQRDHNLYSDLLFSVHTSYHLAELIRNCSVSSSVASLRFSSPKQP